jgi:hypothetical protein
LKFYLCQTSAGPRLSPTQADAKKLDPDFETIELADDKDSRIKHINSLFEQIAGTAPVAAAEPDDEMPVEAPEKPAKAKPGNGSLDWQAAPEAGSCKRCIAMSAAARSLEEIMAITNIEHAIFSMDPPMLSRVQKAAKDRKEELS